MNLVNKYRTVLDDTNRYTLLEADITDRDSVMAEHYLLNGGMDFNYALMKQEGKYYFFNSRKNTAELRKLTDDGKFICPYCLNEVTLCSGYTKSSGTYVDPYLRHINSSVGCIFNRSIPSWQKDVRDYHSREAILHRNLKHYVYTLAKSGQLSFDIPERYAVGPAKGYSVYFEYINRQVRIVDAIKDKNIVYRDGITKEYQPDLTLISSGGEEIYCEISVSTSRNINKYYDVWASLGKTVIEVQLDRDETETRDMLADKLNNRQSGLYKLKDDSFSISYCYHPIVDMAKREHNRWAKIQANKESENKKRQELKSPLRKRVFKSAYDLKKEQRLNFEFCDSGETKWFNNDGRPIKAIKGRVIHEDISFNFTLPYMLWMRLKEEGIEVLGGHKEYY